MSYLSQTFGLFFGGTGKIGNPPIPPFLKGGQGGFAIYFLGNRYAYFSYLPLLHDFRYDMQAL
jgi:hypothetical protein